MKYIVPNSTRGLVNKLADYIVSHLDPNKNNLSFDLELDAILCKKQFKTEEVFIKYKPRTNSKEKKVKWWHMFNFIIGIFKVKFDNKF